MLFAGLGFDMPPGGALVVCGPNGAGKSSLIRVLAGLLPHDGAVSLTVSVGWPAQRALMTEAAALDADQPLGAALRFWARLDPLPGDIDGALAATDLAALADVPVRLLSTGQRRRAAFARLLVARAALWLLDEPGNGLDAAALARLEALIADHRATGGMAVVATHQPIALPGAQEIRLP